MMSESEIVAVLRRAEKCRSEVSACLRHRFLGVDRELIYDCFEDAILVLWKDLKNGVIDPPDYLTAWLLRTSHNFLRNELRKSERFIPLELSAGPELFVPSAAEDIGATYDKNVLLSGINPDYRELLELEDEGFKPIEFSTMFDKSMPAAYKQLERAHGAFETIAARNGYPPPPRFLPSHNNK